MINNNTNNKINNHNNINNKHRQYTDFTDLKQVPNSWISLFSVRLCTDHRSPLTQPYTQKAQCRKSMTRGLTD